jgi:hypothetical protein
MNKAFYKSKILWVNLAGIIAIAFPPAKEAIDYIMSPEIMLILGNLTTIFFRLFMTYTDLKMK